VIAAEYVAPGELVCVQLGEQGVPEGGACAPKCTLANVIAVQIPEFNMV